MKRRQLMLGRPPVIMHGLNLRINLKQMRLAEISSIINVRCILKGRDFGLLAGTAYCEPEDEYLTHASSCFHINQGYSEAAHFKNIGRKFDRWYDLKWYLKTI
jgi:phosphinothricin acetyltransferase